MSDARTKRLGRELAECRKDQSSGILVESVDGSLDHLVGSFPGPTGTPYEGGRFEVNIEVPERYPFSALKMKFITKLYHPNVSSQTGFICLDTLGAGWSPVLTIRTALVSLQSLLSSPEPSDPQDAEVAKHFLSDRASFESTARYWTEVYAKGEVKVVADESDIALAGLEKKDVEQFELMGFARANVVSVLKSLNYRGTGKVGEDEVIQKLLQ